MRATATEAREIWEASKNIYEKAGAAEVGRTGIATSNYSVNSDENIGRVTRVPIAPDTYTNAKA